MRPLVGLSILLVIAGTAGAVPRHLDPTIKAATVKGRPGARITVRFLTDTANSSRASCGLFCVSKLAFATTPQRKLLDDAAKAQSGQHAVPGLNTPVEHTFEVAYDDLGLVKGGTARLVSTWPTVNDAAFHVFGQNSGTEVVLP